MDLQITELQFDKNDDGICNARLTLMVDDNEVSYHATAHSSHIQQTYYLKSHQITPELKTAFHLASLLFKDLFQGEEYHLMVPADDSSPELWVGGKAYYSSETAADHSDFRGVMQECLRAIVDYLDKPSEGDRIAYRPACAIA